MPDPTAVTLVARFADGSTMKNHQVIRYSPLVCIGMKLHLVLNNPRHDEDMTVTITDGEWLQPSDSLGRLEKTLFYIDFDEEDEKKFRPLMEQDPWWIS